MALAGITVKVMPESVDINLTALKKTCEKEIYAVYKQVKELRIEEEPIAFGLCALKFTFIVDEDLGSDIIQERLEKIQGIASAQVVDFRRLT